MPRNLHMIFSLWGSLTGTQVSVLQAILVGIIAAIAANYVLDHASNKEIGTFEFVNTRLLISTVLFVTVLYAAGVFGEPAIALAIVDRPAVDAFRSFLFWASLGVLTVLLLGLVSRLLFDWHWEPDVPIIATLIVIAFVTAIRFLEGGFSG